ncbi:MAG TPA: substrate-binding domain-containing protein [Acetobacteraceae bacterium]|nr:substrate-binding domain-containing protein [Acetobacteraceae bacterium]
MTDTSRRAVLAGLGAGALALPALRARAATPTFALVTINQQALFFDQMNDGAKQAAEKAGVKLVIYNANNDPAAQNNAIDDYIQQKVQGLIVDAIDVNGLMPAVKAASSAGIPVVAVDAVLPAGPQKTQVGVDNIEGGQMAAKYLGDYVKANMGGKAQLGIVGALNSFIQNERQKGFQDALAGDPGIKLVQVVDGRNIQDNAMSVSETLLTGNPQLNTIYATGEPALIGALAAVDSQGRTGGVKVVGWDLSAAAIRAIDKGYCLAVVQQDPSLMGAASVDALVKLLKGESVPPKINTKLTLVTKENVDPYRAVFK